MKNRNQSFFSAPSSERWIFEHFAIMLSQRLSSPYIDDSERQSVTRLLYGIQAFPKIVQGLKLTFSWTELSEDEKIYGIENGQDEYRESIRAIYYSSEGLTFEVGENRLQYFEGNSQLISGFRDLSSNERAYFLENWLNEFQSLEDAHQPINVEDYSEDNSVDSPPLSEFWDKNVKYIFSVTCDE